MKHLMNKSIWILLIIASIIVSCEKDNESASIYERMSSDPNLSEFMNLLIHTKYDAVLKNNEPITVFAPQNDSWDTTNKDKWSELSRLNIVKRHIVMGYCPISLLES